MKLTTRLSLMRWLTVLFVVLAFGNSYRHSVAWALAHSPAHQAPFWAYTIASFPELLVILTVLGFPEARWSAKTLVPGSFAVGWTLWANGSAAAHGPSGLFIALSPAIVSLIALARMHLVTEPEPVHVELIEPVHGEPVSELEPVQSVSELPELTNPEPAQRPAKAQSSPLRLVSGDPAQTQLSSWVHGSNGSRVQRIEWAQAQPVVPSAAQIRDYTECSLATAKRVRSAALPPMEATP